MGGGTVNAIEIQINARDNTLGGLQSAEARMRKSAEQFSRVGKQMMLVGTAGVMAMGGLVKSTVMFGNALDKTMKQTGMTAEQVQRLRYAAEQEHASFETLTRGLPMMTKYLQYAADGQETYAREFRRMGVAVTDTEGNLRSGYDVLLDMADWMSDNGVNDNVKLATAMTLLGRRGAEMVPFLKLGRQEISRLGDEAERTRGFLTDAEVKGLKAFDDRVLMLTETLRGAKDQLAVAVVPALDGLIGFAQRFAEWLRNLSPELKSFVGRLAGFGSIALVVGGALAFVGGKIGLVAIAFLHAIPAVAAFGAAHGLTMGAATLAMAKYGLVVAAVLVGLIALSETLQAVKGLWTINKDIRGSRQHGQELDAIRQAEMSGQITRREAVSQAAVLTAQNQGRINRMGGRDYGMTLGQRAWRDVGNVRQLFATFQKDDEMPAVVADAYKTYMATAQ